LAGWFKQTVDKPNASLSADRRGTLSYPDLESFIISKGKRSKPRAKKTGNILEEDIEEESDEDGTRSKGTKSRPK
jgi:hypothetical protein